MTDEYHFGQFTKEHLCDVRKGVVLFNQQKYWECHEELEHHWLESRGDNARLVYWAVIQVAASMIHYRDNNLAGAQGLIQKAKDKFKRCERLKVETSLLYNYLSWGKLKSLVFAVPDSPSLEDFKELFEFRFLEPSQWDVK